MVKQVTKCPDCGDTHFFINKRRGEVICKNCSFVIEDALLDFGRERFVDNEDSSKNSRTGAPWDPRISNNLMTKVGNKADLFKLNRQQKNLFNRMRRKNVWTSSAMEANLNRALNYLTIISSGLQLTDSVEKEAARIYRMAVERGFTKARSCEKTMLAALYAACKLFAFPKTLKEFADVSNYEKKSIAKMYRLLIRTLKLNITPLTPVDYVNRLASELELDPKTQSQAMEFIEKATELEITSGKSPLSIAASALYMSALLNEEQRTQKAVSDVSQITEVTLRNRCKEMITALKLKRQFKSKISC